MFTKATPEGYKQVLPGILLKTLAHGEKTLLAQFRLEEGARLPLHSHPHEQTGWLVSGRMRFTIGSETIEAGPGDSWCIPGGVLHSAEILAETVLIEVFSPVREDYLAYQVS